MLSHPVRNRLLGSAALVLLAAVTAGCQTTRSAAVAPPSPSPAARSEADWRRDMQAFATRYNANPADAEAAIGYARTLRAIGQRAQAAAVLEQASLHHPHNFALLGAYGRALADIGKLDQALEVLSRAHTPDRPDWRILSVQGAVLDQLGRHEDARRHYAAALRIAPEEPSVLSNLGLSYALSKDLPKAESILRRAAARPDANPRIRQNLALVVGLEGRFKEAESIARADLPESEAAANVAYLRQMLARPDRWNKVAGKRPAAAGRNAATKALARSASIDD